MATRSRARSSSGTPPTGHSGLGRDDEIGRSRRPAPAARTTAAGSSGLAFRTAPGPATLSTMKTRRWTNPSQPQTLYMATFLLYLEGVLSVIFGNAVALFGPIFVIVFIIGAIAGGF